MIDLRLYVAGQTPRSLAAISNLKRICDDHRGNRYRIEVIDLVKNPALARDHQILAIPTLVRSLPVPIRKIIGDLSDEQQVLIGLNIVEPLRKKDKKAGPAASAARSAAGRG
ncbi:MAG: circadian clock KaiB family protein [Acidobacteriia bacterium]|nr:circadian clock KaiB family protein [Terriglobia bacterium]